MIVQTNKNNCIGFFRKKGTDVGVDEHGTLAPGFQYHDALWWEDKETERPPGIDLPTFLKECHVKFSTMANNIHQRLKPKRVLELGCGSGMLSYYLRLYGIMTVTVDANREVVESPYIDHNHFVARTDQELDFFEDGERVIFDTVVSIEHFEHILEERVPVLMRNVEVHTAKDSFLLFTAADWVYEDEDKKHIHPNSKERSWWTELITHYKFTHFRSFFDLQGVDIFATRYTE